ncbi:hypothetical protein PNA2_0738 [Pyrococcus sp. NA2]|uniref:hypothetical protein n=1 Tax=Pyrococcus sp. (strain NA2) TaxID=342949 RepID=UPI000209ADEE|nr:hypothetical protein [Pyrococcus sp. NA2]AEC51653.1 hypothetical protein PNA2_0738 [Pyrococcus sp. NA2]
MLSIAGVQVEFRGELDDGFEEAFFSTFSRRYLPDVSRDKGEPHVIIERFRGEKFRVFGMLYDDVDIYKIESPVPVPYKSESPVFFLLQVTARAGIKIGRVFITDSASILLKDSAILFLGYPHSGKSTILTLAMAREIPILSTENTVVEVRNGGLYIVGGTDVLVYDPRVEEIYGIRAPYDDTTRSGYRIKSVASELRSRVLKRGVRIESIIILHSAFNCKGASFSQIKGRKVRKTLWYFATSLLKGVDYYEPMPLEVPITGSMVSNLLGFLDVASEVKILEAFGSHDEILSRIINDEV